MFKISRLARTVSLGLILLGLIFFHPPYVRAADNGPGREESYTGYDSIVNELKANSDDVPAPRVRENLDWEDVAIHAGVAIAGSYVSVSSPQRISGAGLLKGLELDFGMNLFSRVLRAEGAFSNYAQEELDSSLKADLKQFELRLIYLPRLRDGMTVRFGGGIAARYMNLESRVDGKWVNAEATTPSSLLLTGLEQRVSKNISFGPELSYRSTLVSDTFDKSSWDASFRLNATF